LKVAAGGVVFGTPTYDYCLGVHWTGLSWCASIGGS